MTAGASTVIQQAAATARDKLPNKKRSIFELDGLTRPELQTRQQFNIANLEFNSKSPVGGWTQARASLTDDFLHLATSSKKSGNKSYTRLVGSTDINHVIHELPFVLSEPK